MILLKGKSILRSQAVETTNRAIEAAPMFGLQGGETGYSLFVSTNSSYMHGLKVCIA